MDPLNLLKHFSWRVFAVGCFAIFIFFTSKVQSYAEYQCVLLVQLPTHSEIFGSKIFEALKEQVFIIGDRSVLAERRGQLVAFSSRDSMPDQACFKLQGVKDYLRTLNESVASTLPRLSSERDLLAAFFTRLISNGESLISETGYQPNHDKSLPDLLRRKITLDMLVIDPSLLEFKIIRDSEVSPIPKPTLLSFNNILLSVMGFSAAALMAFLAGIFKILLKSET